jgi:ATP-dependent Clp protease ATP-binding subunit ClpA
VCLFLFYEFQRQLLCFIFSATALDGYKKHIEKEPGVKRCFQPIKVPEPLVDETIKILIGFPERYEIHHKLCYTDDALIAASKLLYQYIKSVNSKLENIRSAYIFLLQYFFI